MSDKLRALPAVGDLIHHPDVAAMVEHLPRSLVVDALRAEIDAARERLKNDLAIEITEADIAAGVQQRACAMAAPKLKRVINATGVVVHTNLGRSPLAKTAIEAVVTAAKGYSNLEYDLAAGRRGSRYALVEELLCELTGAEAALVVNNNAAAVMLALSAFARGREVVVSRGELVEIGGSFRIPAVLAESGARLVEVGTTNRTHRKDFEQAIGEHTAVLLKVHTSNYHILGFTESVSGADLATLAHARGLLAFEDLGSGSMLNTASLGLPHEPTVAEALQEGLDLVTFSGDKLLGGPQAGVLLGGKKIIGTIAENPLHRALRVDKMTLAALEATLQLYRDPQRAMREIPTLRMLGAKNETLRRRARTIAQALAAALGKHAKVSVVKSHGQVGGGALPFAELAGPVVAIAPKHLSVDRVASRLRARAVPVIARIERDRLLLDPRTILDGDRRDLHIALVETLTEETP
ncbi:MAG: L-seryl-tRNA(Sec) selenium transferase [Candidatus Lernaella stagnicola]|nr:L-seryl-tRNA(Sec) selenium transferase [Candidatus Lernaella stagnicola]